jgi:hypothetical protein
MTCTEFESTLADYLDSTLSSVERASIDEHARLCSACREFMTEVSGGLALLQSMEEVEPPSELVTRIAYQTPIGKTPEPFARQTWLGRALEKWLRPVLQPRLAMGLAMTILSFTMLERCTGVQSQHIQPADLTPMRVWGNVEDHAMRVRDRAVKYYENLKIVYEIESRLKDLQDQQDASERQSSPTPRTAATKRQENGTGANGRTGPQARPGNRP